MAAPLHPHLARTQPSDSAGIHHQTMSRVAFPFCTVQRVGGGEKSIPNLWARPDTVARCKRWGASETASLIPIAQSHLVPAMHCFIPSWSTDITHSTYVCLYRLPNLVIVIAIAIARLYLLLAVLRAPTLIIIETRWSCKSSANKQVVRDQELGTEKDCRRDDKTNSPAHPMAAWIARDC
ncbi:hypothetical protein B0T19DRAFT_415297 [Cercophora scortea]|uniref:Uncharacterized protein n=1 Tax=Cercophora scortea TaxID=314031 RepID=A0AAE0IW85_9PEZI|nr:hypothetical protein B0T19DRAFT_415297 [Cercophora scortea]